MEYITCPTCGYLIGQKSIEYNLKKEKICLNNNYTQESTIEPCPIQIKKLFSYSQIKVLINKYLPSLSYHCKGLVFYNLNTKYSNYSMLFPRNHVYYLQSNDGQRDKFPLFRFIFCV